MIGSTTVTGGTIGSVLFIGAAGVVSQDNANFFWDATNHRLGLGTATPLTGTRLDIQGGGLNLQTGFYYMFGGDNFMARSSNSIIQYIDGNINRYSIYGGGTTANGGYNLDFTKAQNMLFTPDSGKALVVKGAAGNTGDIFQGQDNNALVMFNITSGGNVGVGVAVPNGKLDVNGTAYINGDIGVNNSNNITFNYPGNAAMSTGAVRWWNGSSSSAVTINQPGANIMAFTTNSVERMRLDASGNVGINTSSPDIFSRGYSGKILGITSAGQSAIELNSATGNAAYIDLGVNGVRTFSFASEVGDTSFGTIGTNTMVFYTNSINAITISGSNQATTFLGGIVHNVGQTLTVSTGTNQRAGNLTLIGGTKTISNTTVTANTMVMLTRKTSGGTIGTAITYTVSAGTSFTVSSDNILDTSTFSYLLIEVV